MSERFIDLSTIGKGAAAELFAAELAKVLDNITDPNVSWKGNREISLKFKFATDEERKRLSVGVTSSVKLVGSKGIETVAFVGVRPGTGEVVAVEYNPEQIRMAFDVSGPKDAPAPAAQEGTRA